MVDKRHKHMFFRNKTHTCTIGHPPGFKADESSKAKAWNRPCWTSGGEPLYVPPGGIWSDESMYHQTLYNHGEYNLRMFVHTENEEEVKNLGIEEDRIVRDGEKLKGFWGILDILEDVTHKHADILANAVNMISAQEHIERLQKQAQGGDEAKAKVISLEAERNKLATEHALMRAELDRMKANEAVTKQATHRK